MIQTIILDLDGPLLEGKMRHYACYRRILDEQGFEPVSIDEYWEMKRNRIDRRALLERSRAASIYDEFLKCWMERIETQEYLLLDRLQKNVIEILQRWKAAGIRLVLATMRNHPETLRWQLEHLGILPFFADLVVVGSGPDPLVKASGIQASLGNAERKRMMWIGDTEADILAARKLAIPVCALTCGLRGREYLESLSPDFVAVDLEAADQMFFGTLAKAFSV